MAKIRTNADQSSNNNLELENTFPTCSATDSSPLTARAMCLAVLGLLMFLTMYSPSSSSCTSSSTRWPRELMWHRGFTTLPSCSRTTSAELLVRGLNTTSLTFPDGTTKKMSSPKNAVLRSTLKQFKCKMLVRMIDSLLFCVNCLWIISHAHNLLIFTSSHAQQSKPVCSFTFWRCWNNCERKNTEGFILVCCWFVQRSINKSKFLFSYRKTASPTLLKCKCVT